MSLGLIDTRPLRNMLETEPIEVQNAIDEAYAMCVDTLKEHGLRVMGDDRAEELVAAIYYFVRQCRA